MATRTNLNVATCMHTFTLARGLCQFNSQPQSPHTAAKYIDKFKFWAHLSQAEEFLARLSSFSV